MINLSEVGSKCSRSLEQHSKGVKKLLKETKL